MKRRNSSILLRAFRSLMPRDERFIERFCEHSKLIVPAAEASVRSCPMTARRNNMPPKSLAWKMRLTRLPAKLFWLTIGHS